MGIDRLISLISFFEKRAQAVSAVEIPQPWRILYFSMKDTFQIPIDKQDFIDWLLLNKTKLEKSSGAEWMYYKPGAMYAKTSSGLFILYSKEFDISDLIESRTVIDEDRLQPTAKIPAYDFILFSSKVKTLSQEYPVLSHYDFILQTLKDIERVEDFNKNAISFIKENLSKINSLKKLFQQVPQYLGGKGAGSADGVVFKVGDNLILKIFRDNYSYLHAKNIMNKMHPSNEHLLKNKTKAVDETDTILDVGIQELYKTEAMIYDVGILGEWGGKPLYYYLMERMTPSDKIVPLKEPIEDSKIKSSLAYIIRYIGKEVEFSADLKVPYNLIKTKNNSKEAKDLIKKEVKNSTKKILESVLDSNYNDPYIDYINHNVGRRDSFDKSNESSKLKSNWLELLVEEIIMKYLSGRTDIHAGNIGLTNYGEFRYFDPAFDQENYLNV